MRKRFFLGAMMIATLGSYRTVSAIPFSSQPVAVGRCYREGQIRKRSEYWKAEACLWYTANWGVRTLTWQGIPEAVQPCEPLGFRRFLDLVCTNVVSDSLGNRGDIWIATVPKMSSSRAGAQHLAKVMSRAGFSCYDDLPEGHEAQLDQYRRVGLSVKWLKKGGAGCYAYRVAMKGRTWYVYPGGQCVNKEILRGCVNHFSVYAALPSTG